MKTKVFRGFASEPNDPRIKSRSVKTRKAQPESDYASNKADRDRGIVTRVVNSEKSDLRDGFAEPSQVQSWWRLNLGAGPRWGVDGDAPSGPSPSRVIPMAEMELTVPAEYSYNRVIITTSSMMMGLWPIGVKNQRGKFISAVPFHSVSFRFIPCCPAG